MILVTSCCFRKSTNFEIYILQIGRRIKQVPLAIYKVTPGALFWESSDFPGWSFVDSHNNTQEAGNVENGASKIVEKDDAGPAKRQRVESA